LEVLLAARDKRTNGMPWQAVREGNASWWTQNPMTYDWRGDLRLERFSRPWFDAIDERFIDASRPSATAVRPFDLVLPLDRLRGARVLEIGCGMGLHTELMSRAGADVTAIDVSPTAIEATRRRLELAGLSAAVERADAEALPFPDRCFDLVWSWGAIHHTARTARAVREIGRVTRPEGEARVMVYNRHGMPAMLAFVRHHVLGGRFLHNTWDETLYGTTDGFSARYYVREQLEDLFRGFFREVSCRVLGQLADAVPLPRGLRALVAPLVPEPVVSALIARHGAFLFLTAVGPE
jgi:2-polyprenyl-3-methyl-5-hydroxy-6-metoxy-1,4-benzoquinol methylase